jgi:hypothetical protein
MTAETLYTLINIGVVPAWAMLVFAPRWSATRRIVHSGLYPLVYGGLYIVFLANALLFSANSPDAGFSTLAGVMALFDQPNGVLTGWTHYLVFDLFIGAWIGRDALRRGVPHALVAPSLFFCFIFGPVGLLLYLVLRLVSGKGGLALDEQDRQG